MSVSKSYTKQKGAIVILAAFILGLAATAYLLKVFNPESLRVEQNRKTSLALNEAKQALIALAVSNTINPGQFPFPDRNNDGNYDGRSDCPSPVSAFSYAFLIGRLPIYGQTNPCVSPQTGLGVNVQDGQGNQLWYAVSRNLVHKYDAPTSNPAINPSIILTPTYPWLKVFDGSGVLISDRVAAVIISPGNSIGAQDRAAGVADANHYLDTFLIGATVFSNSDYNSADEDFVVIQSNADVNDRLTYITADELIYALEKRVLQEAKNKLTAFYAANSYYPFAAGFGSVANQNQCIQGNLRGLLPVNAPNNHVCTCAAADKTCHCSFSIVSSASFTRDDDSFVPDGAGVNSPTGACSVSLADTKTCSCKGAGGCKSLTGTTDYQCDACGVCVATVDGINKFTTTGAFAGDAGACISSANQASCVSGSDGSFALIACNGSQLMGGLLPAWFTSNQWEKYIVYAVSGDCVSSSTCLSNTSPPKITVGINPKINALVAGSLANPNASCSIASYLNSGESSNINVSNGIQDSLYQMTQPRTLTNGDQIVVIP